MKKLFCILVGLAMTSQASASLKRLECERNFHSNGDLRTIKQQFIFDTDDFDKEEPQAEGTILSYTDDNSQVKDWSRATFSHIGKAYFRPYYVSVTDLRFVYIMSIEESYPFKETESMLIVSRKDLSVAYGSCTIEDYGAI